jgi:ABC-type transport system involved in multi-copper enzyme maturation permease subunit
MLTSGSRAGRAEAQAPGRMPAADRPSNQIAAIAGKEAADAVRVRIAGIVMAFLIGASLVSLTVAGLALHAEVVSYTAAREVLLSLGKPVTALVPPSFHPLKLLRGFIEHLEIIGAVLGLVLGHRAAAVERGRNTLALLLTRPITQTTFLAGKIVGNAVLIYVGLGLVFVVGVGGIVVVSGVLLTAAEIGRVIIVLIAAGLYVGGFFLLGLLLALHSRKLPNAILLGFTIWLLLVLVAPQIGDTLDPDNQAAGGVFKQLGIAKPDEHRIMATFASYETLRDGIEQMSPAKHFERLSFALLGIKDIYVGQPVGAILLDRRWDMVWLAALVAVLALLLFRRRIDFAQLTRE